MCELDTAINLFLYFLSVKMFSFSILQVFSLLTLEICLSDTVSIFQKSRNRK